ncbi:hypothetical protein Ct9H90mP29_02500 [bacterium]|nr:MAG: hypothetical protein Ct9H90mP29_02500 [bacterium]
MLEREEVRVDNLDISIPDSWVAPLPASEEVSGDWWSVFEDPVLDTFLVQLRSNSPGYENHCSKSKKSALQCKNKWRSYLSIF